MPRKPTKNNTETTMSAIDEAINTPVNFQFCELAEALGIGDAELRERLEEKTGNSEVHQMDTIPYEWEPAIKAIKIDLEAESSVRRLNEATEPPIEQQPLASELEPPIVEDEAKPKKGSGRKKKESTALTKKGSKAIEKSAEATDSTQNLEDAVLLELSRLRGDKRGSNMAAVEDTAEQERYTRNRKNSLTRKVAKLVGDIEVQADFDPVAFVKARTGSSADDNLNDIQDLLGKSLGKCQEAVEEIGDNSYPNGKTLDLSKLETLMNSNK
jgi:hypothetical protein